MQARSYLFCAVLFAAITRGVDQDPNAAQAATNGSYPLSPIRVEFGGYSNAVNNGFGTWNGGVGQIWYRNRYFTPTFTAERQTRPAGSQWNYSFFSYLNWSKSFYTTQGYSWAPQKSVSTTYFPLRRYDIRGYWKLPPNRNILPSVGFTRYDLGPTGHGQIFSTGVLVYHNKWVVDSNLFINRNQPGDLYSASGLVAVQYGQEGKSWLGVTVGGGRELYQLIGQTPIEARFMSYSVSSSYRRWITKHTGFVISGEYVDKLDAYRRGGGSARLFFEF